MKILEKWEFDHNELVGFFSSSENTSFWSYKQAQYYSLDGQLFYADWNINIH
jgi:hypothetical protein